MTAQDIKKYVEVDLGQSLRHDPDMLLEATQETAATFDLGEWKVLRFMLANEPVMHSHSYGFHPLRQSYPRTLLIYLQRMTRHEKITRYIHSVLEDMDWKTMYGALYDSMLYNPRMPPKSRLTKCITNTLKNELSTRKQERTRSRRAVLRVSHQPCSSHHRVDGVPSAGGKQSMARTDRA